MLPSEVNGFAAQLRLLNYPRLDPAWAMKENNGCPLTPYKCLPRHFPLCVPSKGAEDRFTVLNLRGVKRYGEKWACH